MSSDLARMHKMLSLVLVIACLVSAAGLAYSASDKIIDNTRGGYYMSPYDGNWYNLGADFGLQDYPYDSMQPEAVKGIHGRLQHFELQPDNNYSYFPTQLCKNYEADEVSEGRNPLWVTIYYQGEHRPALYEGHWLYGWGATQAINTGDDRFVKFFIKQYCRAVLMEPYRPLRDSLHPLLLAHLPCSFPASSDATPEPERPLSSEASVA